MVDDHVGQREVEARARGPERALGVRTGGRGHRGEGGEVAGGGGGEGVQGVCGGLVGGGGGEVEKASNMEGEVSSAWTEAKVWRRWEVTAPPPTWTPVSLSGDGVECAIPDGEREWGGVRRRERQRARTAPDLEDVHRGEVFGGEPGAAQGVNYGVVADARGLPPDEDEPRE